jgi:hypothetical protein
MAREHGGLPHDFIDRVIRTALQEGGNLRALIRAVFPEIADQLDYSRLEIIPTKFLLDDWRQRESDILICLPYKEQASERSLVICILIEHQSTPDQAPTGEVSVILGIVPAAAAGARRRPRPV